PVPRPPTRRPAHPDRYRGHVLGCDRGSLVMAAPPPPRAPPRPPIGGRPAADPGTGARQPRGRELDATRRRRSRSLGPWTAARAGTRAGDGAQRLRAAALRADACRGGRYAAGDSGAGGGAEEGWGAVVSLV